MTLRSLLTKAFEEARSVPDRGAAPAEAHRNRAKVWVESVAGAFRSAYRGSKDVRVFSKQFPGNRPEFGASELLYDVHVCRVATTAAAGRPFPLAFLLEALWQVESQFSEDPRLALHDFNRLVAGAARCKLFIGPQVLAPKGFLDALLRPAQACSGTVYAAFVPHPRRWDDAAPVIDLRRLEGRSWAPVRGGDELA